LSGGDAFSIVSLGDGRQWLTSRLLIFTVVLQELRGTRCLVITRRLGVGEATLVDALGQHLDHRIAAASVAEVDPDHVLRMHGSIVLIVDYEPVLCLA
jgi:hypothetical protein